MFLLFYINDNWVVRIWSVRIIGRVFFDSIWFCTGQFDHNGVCKTKWMYDSGESCGVILEIKHITWSGNIVYSYQCRVFFSGWVSSLSFSLSLWGFTSHCSASKSVRTFVVVMETDIKRWLDCCWNKDWMGQSREGSYERDNLLNQGDMLRN